MPCVFIIDSPLTVSPGGFFTFELSRTYPVSRYPTFIDALRDIDDALCLSRPFDSKLRQTRKRMAALRDEYTFVTKSLPVHQRSLLSSRGSGRDNYLAGFTLRVNCPYGLHSADF